MYLERSIFRHLASRISNGVRGWCQQMMLVRTARMASAPMMEPEGLPPSSDKTVVAGGGGGRGGAGGGGRGGGVGGGGGVDRVGVGVGRDLGAKKPDAGAREPPAAGLEPDAGVGAGHGSPAVVGAGIRVGAVHDDSG